MRHTHTGLGDKSSNTCLRSTLPRLEVFVSEAVWQQVFDRHGLVGAVRLGEDHHVVEAKLRHGLSARATGRGKYIGRVTGSGRENAP